MNADDADELDRLQTEVAEALVRAMDDEVSWWTSLSLMVAHDRSCERSVISYEAGDQAARSLSTDHATRLLVAKFRHQLERCGLGGVRRWRLRVEWETGAHCLDTSADQPWHGSVGWVSDEW